LAATKISLLTTDAAPHRTNDFAPTYDASAVATKKVALRDFGMYVLYAHVANSSPGDSTTYYFGAYTGIGLQTTDGGRGFSVPRAGIITHVAITAIVTGTVGSAETSSMYLRKNATSDTLLTSTFALNSAGAWQADPNVTVAALDFVEIKWISPAWATNPTGVYIQVLLAVE
jgi:hypothetical protein